MVHNLNAELKKQLAKFRLEMHEGKTKLIEFGRFAIENRKEHGEGKPETFDFLGFTHICSKKKNGHFTIYRKTTIKRLRDKIKKVREMLLRKRHRPVSEQGACLRAIMQGHFNYYGVPGNTDPMGSPAPIAPPVSSGGPLVTSSSDH